MSPLRLNGSTSGSVSLDCPAVGGNNTLVLPGGNGSSGQYLQTNGSGTLSWATVATGKILQVVQATKTDTTSTTSTSFSDLTGMSVSITPANTSNKVLIVVQLGGVSSASFTVLFNLVRGTNTNLAQPDAGTNKASMNIYTNGAAPGGHSLVWLDSPSSISSLTYKLQWRVDQGTGFFNRHSGSADYSSVSTITALEVAA